MNDDPKYYDQDGRECSLQTLCTREPGWAASRIRTMRTALEESERAASLNAHALNRCTDEKLAAWREIEELKRQRDEARGLLREAYSRIRCEDEWDTMLCMNIDAHLSEGS